jgi:hypothetical protein
VHKGSTQTNKRLKLGFKYKGAKKLSVLWSSALDCSVCHRTVSGAPGPYRVQTTTLGFLQAHFAIIHRIVRCTTGVRLPAQRSTATVPLTALQCAAEVSTEVRGTPDSEQCLSGAAPEVFGAAPEVSGATRRLSLQRSTAPKP